MSKNVSEFVVERMQQWGVRRIFGYPGDGIAGLDVAVDNADQAGTLKFVQVRHEEMAAFMASAHAKFTGEVGVCMATSGPGAVHLLNGLYDARLDHQPVVALVGQHGTPVIGGSDQQELDLKSLFKDVAGAYCEMASDPVQVRHLIDRAFRIAIAERRVTCVVLPANIQIMPAVEKPPHLHGYEHSSIGYSKPRVVPYEADLQRAADILNQGKKVSILIGAGAKGATDELIEVADLLGCGIAKALLGKQVVPDDLPFVTGSIGLLGTEPSSDMMLGCDTLLMVGSGFPWTEFLPKEGQARAVQIDIDPEMLGLRYPMDVHLHGDSQLTLQALIPLLQAKAGPVLARGHREEHREVVGAARSARHARGRAAQPAAGVLGAVVAPARARDRHRGLRLRRQLVCARPQVPARHDGLAVRRARLARRRHALRGRRQVRLSRPHGDHLHG